MGQSERCQYGKPIYTQIVPVSGTLRNMYFDQNKFRLSIIPPSIKFHTMSIND